MKSPALNLKVRVLVPMDHGGVDEICAEPLEVGQDRGVAVVLDKRAAGHYVVTEVRSGVSLGEGWHRDLAIERARLNIAKSTDENIQETLGRCEAVLHERILAEKPRSAARPSDKPLTV